MTTPTAATSTNQPVDGLALWDSEGGGGPGADLAVIRLDQNQRFLVPFTTMVSRTFLHYLTFPTIRGYVQCNGADCLLCRVGRQRDERDLWPAYDVLDKAVGVLPISPSLRPHALRPLLTPVLRRLAAEKGPLLITLRRDGYKFDLDALPLPRGAEDGAAAIRAFRERFDAGHIDLAAPFPKIANEDLAMIEEIRVPMVAKGITLG